MYDINKEIELACKRENPDWDGKSFDYGCSIYQNVLECYNALQPIIEKAGHSGCSYGFFVNILNRALKSKPLTPITEEDDFGTDIDEEQCPRYSALFRHIDEDGKVTYRDIYRCVTIDQHGSAWNGGIAEKCCKEFIPPITLPYMPTDNPIKIYVWEVTMKEDGSFTVERGTYNTLYVDKIVFPNGDVKIVNKLFSEVDEEVTDYSFEALKKAVDDEIEERKKY